MLKISRFFVVSLLFLLTLVVFLTFNPDSYDLMMAGTGDIVVWRESSAAANDSAYEVALVTDSSTQDEAAKHISLALKLLKRSHRVCASVQEAGNPKTIIMAASSVADEEVQQLKAFLTGGGNVIFATLPEMTEPVMELLEIASFSHKRYVYGFEVYEGVMLGGMFSADRILYRCQDVRLSGRCKVLANGFNLGSKDEEMTPLLWRTYYNGGAVLAFNAPFIEDASGMGILAGALALAQHDFLYPIVGTRSVALDHFPFFSDDEIDGRSSFVFTRDIVWPGLLSITRNTGLTLTCYASGGLGSGTDAYTTWNFMMRELQKIRGELGYTVDDPQLLDVDVAFLRGRQPSYKLRSLKASGAKNLSLNDATSLMVDGWEGAMEWLSGQTVSLPLISEGTKGGLDDFRMASAVTLMGFAAHRVDMTPVYREDVTWGDYSFELGSYLNRTMMNYDYLRAVTVSLAAEEVKNYLNTSLNIERLENAIAARMTGNMREMSFILRTHREVDIGESEGCVISAVEPDVYLVKSSGPEFVIHFKGDAEAER